MQPNNDSQNPQGGWPTQQPPASAPPQLPPAAPIPHQAPAPTQLPNQPQPPGQPAPQPPPETFKVKPSRSLKKPLLIAGLVVILAAVGAGLYLFLFSNDTVDKVAAAVGMTCERPNESTGSAIPELDIEFEGVIARCSWDGHRYEVLTEQDFSSLFNVFAELGGEGSNLQQACADPVVRTLIEASWTNAISATVVEDLIFMADSAAGADKLSAALAGSGLDHEPFDADYLCSLT